MTEQELIERLAAAEHDSWARWQAHVHALCERREDGALVIPASRVAAWQRQIDTPYTELSESEKQSDRDEVAHILPIIWEYTTTVTAAADLAVGSGSGGRDERAHGRASNTDSTTATTIPNKA